ncbi:MAG: hydroxyacid dehydrogenase [Halanaeroarchaeum sp.]
MTRDRWNVLLPPTIDPRGPRSIEDVATFAHWDDYEDRSALLDDVDRYEAIVVRVSEVSRELIEAATDLQVVAKHGAGMDNIDVAAASEAGVIVCNTPGANARSVAEHAITLLSAVRRNVVEADRAVRSGSWGRHRFQGRELQGTTLGLFGFGDIAREVATIAAAYGTSVVAYDPYVSAEEMPDHVDPVEEQAALFSRADAASVHTPLTEETRGAIGTEELTRLGEEGVIVNTSRGGIVDEDALLDALASGAIEGAGLDVFAEEPPAADDPLLSRDDVVLTPHVGGLTDEAMERMSRRAAENVRTVYDGGVPDSTVKADRL